MVIVNHKKFLLYQDVILCHRDTLKTTKRWTTKGDAPFSRPSGDKKAQVFYHHLCPHSFMKTGSADM
ncbi:hypothetical protein ASG66_14150 [Bacillus sp. Leaf406]|nr:hypothetical protein ASG66_14150 [Bacillus sp. Leaf406]